MPDNQIKAGKELMNNMNEYDFGLVSFSRVSIHDDKKEPHPKYGVIN